MWSSKKPVAPQAAAPVLQIWCCDDCFPVIKEGFLQKGIAVRDLTIDLPWVPATDSSFQEPEVFERLRSVL